jgi:sulfur carrier protein ThiS
MKIKVKIFPGEEKVVRIRRGETYQDLLLHLGINPETALVFRGREPLPQDEKAQSGEIRVIKVISGG